MSPKNKKKLPPEEELEKLEKLSQLKDIANTKYKILADSLNFINDKKNKLSIVDFLSKIGIETFITIIISIVATFFYFQKDYYNSKIEIIEKISKIEIDLNQKINDNSKKILENSKDISELEKELKIINGIIEN